MAEAGASIPVRLLRGLTELVLSRRKLFIYPQILLFGLAVFYTVQNLKFNMARNDLVGSDKIYHQNYLKYKDEFRVQDDFVVVVESEDQEKNRQFVERIAAKLEAETNTFKEVFYKGDLKMLGKKALLFLDEPTLADLRTRLEQFEPFVQQFAQATNLNSLFGMINAQFRLAAKQTNATNPQMESMIESLPALRRIINLGTDSMRRSGTPPSPGITALFDAGAKAQEQQYITFAKGRFYLVTCRGADGSNIRNTLDRLRMVAQETYAEVPGINVGITGEPVLEVDEMRQSQDDSTVATILSLVVCAAIFIIAYRQVNGPLKATAALIIGLGYTMGYTTLVIGHLNILTVTFLPILIGMAIDFGVHLITRFEEEIKSGETEAVALERAMVNTGLGIFTGCLTTAGAFFAMGLTDFKGIQEMGIITGGGMVVCLIPMMTFLPATLLGKKKSATAKTIAAKPLGEGRAKLERLWLDRPRSVIVGCVVVTLAAVWGARAAYFDYNLLHMQSRGLPAVLYEHKLIESASKSVLYGVIIAENSEHALALEGVITNLPSVATVDSMARFLGGDQTEKLRMVGQVKEVAARIQFATPDLKPVMVEDLSRTMWSLNGYLGLALDELKKYPERTNLVTEIQAIRQAIEGFRYEMLNRDRVRVTEVLGDYQRALFDDLRSTFHAIATQDTSSALQAKDLPPALQSRFIGKTGRQIIQVYPKGDIWQREPQAEFVKELRTVDPNVTGTPVQLYEYTSLLRTSYEKAAWYALAAIAILVLFHFRSLTAVVLALLPVVLGSLWTLGLMGLFGIPFNPANIMTLPLVVGIGVTNGIHILNRFAEEQNPSILAKSTGKAVIVSALTTIAGFGSLIPAAHQGIQSLGIVMSLGVAMCMLAALTFLPALLQVMIAKGWKVK